MAGCDVTQVLFERMMTTRATDNAVHQVSYCTANQGDCGNYGFSCTDSKLDSCYVPTETLRVNHIAQYFNSISSGLSNS